MTEHFHVTEVRGLAVLELAHPKPQNPMSRAMTRALVEQLTAFERSPPKGLLVWGGPGRSFSVGGDFEDVRRLASFQDVVDYLDEIYALYLGLLRVPCPVVAALDHFTIGQGLQFALMADWRIATDRAQLVMPELKNGAACPLGSVILEHLLGRAAMMHLVVGCEPLSASQARELALVNELSTDLFEAALTRLATFAGWHPVPFRETKAIHNERFAAALNGVKARAAHAHANSFNVRAPHPHFERILGTP